MSSPEQVRQKLVDVSRKRADAERRMAEARGRQAKKNEEAASYRQRAATTSSASMAKSHLRSADTAEKAALAEGRKVADESKKSAECSRQEANLNKDLVTALKNQATKEKRDRDQQAAADKRRREAEQWERDRQARAAAQAHQREIQAERARTQALLAAAEGRLTADMSSIRPPQVEQLRILYLTATSHGDLRVDEEMRRVKAAVQAATHRDLVKIEHRPAATTSDLLDGLTRFKPHVVHFSGHAGQDVLVFDTGSDTHGPGQRVTAGAFQRAMSAVDEPPTLVVLNACKSEGHLAGLLEGVPLAIGMADSVGDRDAMAFAARFYSAVAEGQSVESSWKLARSQMELDGLPDAALPILDSQPGVDPALVHLVIAPE
ncbi:MAG: CHAT domain-containing protein [Actinomycetota bacterium]|nr:CHAT domain-containing protein [Actinomycetota bacterium]